MLGTAGRTAGPVDTTAPPRPAWRDISARLAGAGALAFVVVVAGQNVLRGASAPANGATATTVADHYADHRSVTVALVVMFVISGASLAVFLGGAMRRLTSGPRPGWACTGLVGATGIIVLFATLVGVEEALSVVATGSDPDVGAVQALWALHNSVFTVLYLAIGLGLLGLGRAGVAAGITPRAFEWLAPLGFVLLAAGAAAGPSIAAGDAAPAFGLAGLGFLTWLAFLVTTGLRLLRSDARQPIAA
jgi:hypothetical protein